MEPLNQNREQPLPALRQKLTLPVFRPAPGATADCWNQIGVAGDATCPELPQVVHCRNCPVYSAVGNMLLDRAAPPEYRRELTEHFSNEKKRLTPGKHSVMIFRLGPEWLALPSKVVQEIAEWRPIHSVPHRRRGVVLGFINVRGELVLCVSLARLLGINGGEPAEKRLLLEPRLILAEWDGRVLAFPVDEIDGIHRYQPEELKPLPATAAQPSFATGLIDWREKMAGCLDAELLFTTLNRNLQ